MDFTILPINLDIWRPGMPDSGYVVYYDSTKYGYMCRRFFETKIDAENFANGLPESALKKND